MVGESVRSLVKRRLPVDSFYLLLVELYPNEGMGLP